MKTLINIAFILTLIGLAAATYYKDELISGYSRKKDAVMSKMFGDDKPVEAYWKRYLKAGYALLDEGLCEDARDAVRQAIGEAGIASGVGHTDIAACYRALAYAFIDCGQYDDADKSLAKAIEMLEKTSETDNAMLADLLKDKGDNYMRLDKPAEAADTYNRLLEVGDASHSAHARVSLGHILFAKAEYDEAESAFRKGIELMDDALKLDRPEVSSALISLGHIKLLKKKYSAAEPLFNRAINIRKGAFGEDDPAVAEGLISLSILYEAREKYDRAFSALELASGILNSQAETDSEMPAFVENRLERLRR